jgi:uncharacterized membrane protein
MSNDPPLQAGELPAVQRGRGSMTALTVRQTERIARKTNVALTLAIILGAIEILRRAPRWLLIGVALLAYMIIALAIIYIWWIVAPLSVLVAWKLVRGFVQGCERPDNHRPFRAAEP